MRLLLVDDTEDELRRLARTLESVPHVSVDARMPPSDLKVAPLLKRRFDAVLIDYDLSKPHGNQEPAYYKGSTLAAALRERLPETPLVLVTKKKLFDSDRVDDARNVTGPYEDLVVKETIYSDPRQFVGELGRIMKGFRTLRAVQDRSWSSLLVSLDARGAEVEDLLAAAPPQELTQGTTWRVTEASRWIRKTLLRYPGVLYNSLHAATAMGIARQSFLRPSVQRFFRSALYRGPFAPEQPFFWKGRLLVQARSCLRSTGASDEPLTAFQGAWKSRTRERLATAKCVSSGKAPADCVCVVLNAPVLRQESLPYHPDTRPSVMDEARISFKALKVGNDFDERFLPPDARLLLDRIQRGRN